MDTTKEFISHAIDSANALSINTGAALGINPQIWDERVRDFEEKQAVVTNLAGFFDMRTPSASLTVTVDALPTAAALTADTVDASTSAFSTRQVTFSCSEYTKMFQVTRAEMETTFFNAMDRASRGIGSAMNQARETAAMTAIYAGAGNSVIVNGKSATTDLASTDTLNYDAITKAVLENQKDRYINNKYLIVSYTQMQALLNLGQVYKANEFGTRDAIQNGYIGMVYGLQIFASLYITPTSNVEKAVVMAISGMGEPALGYAVKRDTTNETEYHAAGRRYDVVGSANFGFSVLHPNGLCTIATYA